MSRTSGDVGGERGRVPTRRDFLRRTSGLAVAGVLAAGTHTAAAQSGVDFGGWFEDVENFDGTIADERGSDSVTVSVGVDGSSGPYLFDPPAVRVDPGTTVVFEWESDTHNVLPESIPDGADWGGHETLEDEGATYEHTFETEGVYTYYCDPHRRLGMKGAVVVGDEGAGSSGGGGGGSSSPLPSLGLPVLLLGGLGIATASFVAGMYYGGRREGHEQSSAALAGVGAMLIGLVFIGAVLTKLVLA